MRRVISSTYLSLDGVVTHPERWTFQFRDDEANGFAHEQLFASDALLMGRQTYELFARVWPTRKDTTGMADRMNSLPKYVVSTTLERADAWNNSTVINGDVPERISALKQQPGKDIMQYGYGRVTDLLIQHDLLDQLRIWLHPILVGSGELDDLLMHPRTKATLRLADLKRYDSGVLILTYEPVRS